MDKVLIIIRQFSYYSYSRCIIMQPIYKITKGIYHGSNNYPILDLKNAIHLFFVKVVLNRALDIIQNKFRRRYINYSYFKCCHLTRRIIRIRNAKESIFLLFLLNDLIQDYCLHIGDVIITTLITLK